MKLKVKLFLVLSSVFIFSFSETEAQKRGCGTPDWENYISSVAPGLAQLKPGSAYFENWMAEKLQEPADKSNALYTIPVVVHIIHNGEAEGTGRNLSEARVLSQIRILNEDFRKMAGTPGFNTHPAGVDTRIEFKLAQRTPDGQPTNGIVRIQGPKATWTLNDNNTLKNLSKWPEDDYLNLWVCDLANDLIGYAQFPLPFDSLPYSGQYENIMPDGVVIDYQVFGDVPPGESGPFTAYNKGRTCTHEVGHFLGLLHLWGDVLTGCGDDFCNDTPLQEGWTTGCPQSRITCGAPNMFQNYLDYTRDACMNIFTADQMKRMHVVLRNSPRRKSLTTSMGATPPVHIAERISSPCQSIYPNPNNGSFQIQMQQNTEFLTKNRILITNISGQSIPFQLTPLQIQGQYAIRLKNHRPGIYFIQITLPSGSVNHKIMVQ